MSKSKRSALAAALGRLGKGKKKTMSPAAIEQRRAAGFQRGRKPPKGKKERHATA